MKKILVAVAVVGLVALGSMSAMAKPGQGQGKAQDAAQEEVFGQEPAAGQCQGQAMACGEEGKGCGCHQQGAMGEEGKGCACGAMGEEGKGCACGPDCKCGAGAECKCGAMGGEGKGCGCHHQGAMGEEGKGCGGHGDAGMHKGHHKGDHKFWKCPRARAELNLTDDQVKKLEDMDAAGEQKLEAIHGEMKVLKDQMHALLMADIIDVDAIRELAGKMGAKKSDKMVIKMVQKAEAMNILTAEQRGRMKELHAKMKGHMGGMDDAELTDPKAMEEKAAHLEKKAKELDTKARNMKKRAKSLKEKAKKAKKGGKGKN